MSSLSVTTQTSVYLFHQITEIHVENNQILISKLYHQLIDEDVQCDILREEFNVYNLSNNMVMSVKTVVGQVRRTEFV